MSATHSESEENRETLLFLGNRNIARIVYEENGVAKGIAVDLIEALERKMDYNIEVQALDWVEAQSKVLTEEADALIQINLTSERQELYDFSDEFLESEFSIFTVSSDTYINKVDDFKGRTVGAEKGGYGNNVLLEYEALIL